MTLDLGSENSPLLFPPFLLSRALQENKKKQNDILRKMLFINVAANDSSFVFDRAFEKCLAQNCC